jgi:hypothetical protein
LKGGFFKAHVDTPKDPKRMIGTLVVVFPTQFEGNIILLFIMNKYRRIALNKKYKEPILLI